MNSTSLREFVFHHLKQTSMDDIARIILQASDALEQYETEKLIAPVQPANVERKSGWFDWFIAHPSIKYRPQDREIWEGLHRQFQQELEMAYSDGCFTLEEVQKWRASTAEERDKAKRLKIFTEALRRWNFAHGYEQAKDWWTTLRNRGSVPAEINLMVKAVEWLGRTCKDRSVSLAFANQAIGLIDEYRSLHYGKTHA